MNRPPPNSTARKARVQVPEALGGARLDKVLAQLVPELSRREARKVLAMGAVTIGKKRVRIASWEVRTGDEIALTWHPDVLVPEHFALEIVYQDAAIAIVSKPAGQLSQGSELGDVGSLQYALMRHFGQHVRLMHRLDKGASGLLVAGLGPDATAFLTPQFRAHALERRYLALTVGTPAEGRCSVPIVIAGRDARAARPGEDGLPAGTDVTLDATVTDRDNNLLKVEFFDGATKLGEKTASPFTQVVKTPATGDHAFRVVATDRTSMVGWATVNFAVREFVADRIDQIDDTADEGAGLNQIAYNNTWNLAQGNVNDPRFKNNDHYSDVRNAYFEVRFTGVKIEVFATVASHHGSGVATIDGGTEYTVSYKAPQRKEQALVWSSPILPNREHVLRIRVAGNGVVTADRFDVHVSTKPDVDRATIKKVTATLTGLAVEVEDAGTSVVDPSSAKLLVDAASVTATVVKAASTTTLTHASAAAFQPGSTHTVKVDGKYLSGASFTVESSFTLPKPFFPLTGLGEPSSTAGNWGFRQIWNAGRADALVSAVDLALQASRTGFTGKIHDTTVPSINFAETTNPGTGGFIPDNLPLPAEAQGLTENDFVIVGRAKVRMPQGGDWTIGVHSDEGFALRFIGAPFASVSGNGERDDNFPEYIAFQTNTGDSNTRGILRGLTAGDYEIEFISWERVGPAFFEVYAAPGAFQEDAETDRWQLIGGPGGLQIIASGPKLTAIGLSKANDRLTIDFLSPQPAGPHQLQESTDFKTWQAVSTATFQKTDGNNVRASVIGVTATARFYRLVLP